MDRVTAAVKAILSLVSLVRKGDRLGDGDALLDLAEQTVESVSALRDGAEQVQKNVVELEEKVKSEMLPLKDEIMKMNNRVSMGENAFQNVASSVTGLSAKIAALEALVSVQGSMHNGGAITGRDRGILEYKAIQGLKMLGGDKGQFRQWHQKMVSAMFTVKDEYGKILKYLEKSLDVGTKADDIQDELEEDFDEELVEELSMKLYTLLMDKAENEAYEKIRG